ncbi:hypothetical protein BLS_009470 [Venturia inaequalis]|uniref:tRNA(Phe) 7-[(3-amino-3-carboxypropyl)-4-demethylwyosine(37)-N(4)]-methyltransferase n=1 Tax=Venturia inaequalis TaxID=5025 RepID=A0A8H3V301_VENIN|nr:hypothetical protein EG328_001536 [Venturia inaequalis]KAE9979788.1 hypothetical protein BLS_009470 [Venturia inaequalis]KAE9991525.1 hypothetical protein EG327_011546 [Venturia inaequalis]
MSTNFQAKKRKILEQIEVPDDEYTDLSPKGSIDVGIRHLVREINKIHGLVTTSSCAGRISVFLEGTKKTSPRPLREEDSAQEPAIAGPGGKGGGKWLFVDHEPVSKTSSTLHALFGIDTAPASPIGPGARFVHFKFEAMILHLLAASLTDAHAVLSAASSAGFRESGAMGLSSSMDGTVTPMVAVRSTGLGFDSIIGYQNIDGSINSLVTEEYLELLINTANERFKTNNERIERFRSGLSSFYHTENAKIGGDSCSLWEDKDARKARKRAEGLAKQKEKLEEVKSDMETPS